MTTLGVVLVRCDADWEALYVDGARVSQGHTVAAETALRVVALLNAPFTFETVFSETDYVDEHGEHPASLDDVPRQET